MSVWRQLLRRPAEQLPQNGHAAIDATYFDRQQASAHSLRRTGRSVRTIQTTFLVDTAAGGILGTKWPDATEIGPKVALRNAGDLLSLAADRGYDAKPFRDELRANGVRPLIKHRIYWALDHAHNARLDSDRYHQHSMAETVFSSIKRTHGSAERARSWYREFREIVLMCVVYNIKRAVTQ